MAGGAAQARSDRRELQQAGQLQEGLGSERHTQAANCSTMYRPPQPSSMRCADGTQPSVARSRVLQRTTSLISWQHGRVACGTLTVHGEVAVSAWHFLRRCWGLAQQGCRGSTASSALLPCTAPAPTCMTPTRTGARQRTLFIWHGCRAVTPPLMRTQGFQHAARTLAARAAAAAGRGAHASSVTSNAPSLKAARMQHPCICFFNVFSTIKALVRPSDRVASSRRVLSEPLVYEVRAHC